ncbi:MAG: hypothetical protein AYK23_01670 [Candidatus Proteinoplasmatales archaeon SG8-5]|nr:MAG: hypothetical protein AYK23_01670 [Candidatus Proteinoplasmatales archaeon SG8-5]
MTDFREKVKDDRGLLKKIELAIPGFRGYRKREDLRIADRLLREELANGLGHAATAVEEARNALAKRKELDLLEDMAKLVIRINTSVERIKHAEQGYTGVSPDYRIEEHELNRMYEWDLGLLDDIQTLKAISTGLQANASSMPVAEMSKEIEGALTSLASFDQLFDSRREAFANLQVKE